MSERKRKGDKKGEEKEKERRGEERGNRRKKEKRGRKVRNALMDLRCDPVWKSEGERKGRGCEGTCDPVCNAQYI